MIVAEYELQLAPSSEAGGREERSSYHAVQEGHHPEVQGEHRGSE